MGTTFDRACREHRENAGHKGCARNPISGGCIEFYDAARQGVDVDGRFAVVCSEHGSLMGADTKRDAVTLAHDVVEWCADCGVLDAGMPRPVRPLFDGFRDALVAHLADDVVREFMKDAAERVKARRAGHVFDPDEPNSVTGWLLRVSQLGWSAAHDACDANMTTDAALWRHGFGFDDLDVDGVDPHAHENWTDTVNAVETATRAAAVRALRSNGALGKSLSPCACATLLPPPPDVKCTECGRTARVIVQRDADGNVVSALCTACVDPSGALL